MSARRLAAFVPRDWGPEQALGAVRLLRMVQDAIWWVHGEAMVAVVGELDPGFEHLDELIDPDAMDELDDGEPPYGDPDDIPF